MKTRNPQYVINVRQQQQQQQRRFTNQRAPAQQRGTLPSGPVHGHHHDVGGRMFPLAGAWLANARLALASCFGGVLSGEFWAQYVENLKIIFRGFIPESFFTKSSSPPQQGLGMKVPPAAAWRDLSRPAGDKSGGGGGGGRKWRASSRTFILVVVVVLIMGAVQLGLLKTSIASISRRNCQLFGGKWCQQQEEKGGKKADVEIQDLDDAEVAEKGGGVTRRRLIWKRLLRHRKQMLAQWTAEMYNNVTAGANGTAQANVTRTQRLEKPKKVCWSQLEQKFFYEEKVNSSSLQAFRNATREYIAMHAKCTKGIDNWLDFAVKFAADSKSFPARSGCKYLFWNPPPGRGLGNQIVSLVASFTYALITDRVLLLPSDAFVVQFACSPFGDSPWTLPEGQWKQVYQWIKSGPGLGGIRAPNWDGQKMHMFLLSNMQINAWDFYCDEEQEAISRAPFVSLDTDEYLTPIYYLIPQLEARLDLLFPDRCPFTHTIRFLLNPINYIWDKIIRSFHAYLEQHHRLVGLQIRPFDDKDGKADIMPRIMQCAIEVAKVLPPTISRDEWSSRETLEDDKDSLLLLNLTTSVTGVFVMALNPVHHQHVKDFFSHNKPRDGSSVLVHSESWEGWEKHDNAEQYQQALVEMWLLSFSDHLLVSDYSSFGYIAVGLSGLRPHSMNIGIRESYNSDWRTNGRGICTATMSEPCLLQLPPGRDTYMCHGEHKNPAFVLPHVKTCPSIAYGLVVEPREMI